MKRPRILLLGPAAYLLLVYGYLLLFYRCPMPSVRSEPGQEWNRLTLLFALVRQVVLWPGDIVQDWFGAPGEAALLDRLPVLLIAGLILAFAAAVGWLLMALCRADRGLKRLEIYVFSTAVGLNAVSTFVLAVGLLGWIGNPLVFAVPAALTLAAAGRLRWRRVLAEPAENRGRGNRESTAADQEDEPGLSRRWLWLAAPFVLMILLGGMLPPVHFDVREYHLQVPKEFFQQGRIAFLPHNIYGNMAMGSQMHSLLCMVIADDWWLGALAGKTLIAALAPLTALALLAAGRRFFSTTAGIVAAVVYLSIPWIVKVSTAGLVDGASAYYLLLSVYAVLLYGQRRNEARCAISSAREGGVGGGDDKVTEPRPPGRGYCDLLLGSGAGRGYCDLLLGGYLAGGAVSCKYPGVLFVLLPLAAWLFFSSLGRFSVGRVVRSEAGRKSGTAAKTDGRPRRIRSARQASRAVGIFLLAALLGCGLWFGKNWVLTGNPTYPLLYEYFGGKTRTVEKDRQWTDAHRPEDFSAAALGNDLARVGLRSEWLSPLLVPLAVLALLDRRRRRLVIAILAYFGFTIAAWWLFTHRIDRFWIPGLPLVALLAGAGACWSRRTWWRRTLIGVLVLGLAANLLVADLAGYHRYFVRLDHLRRDRHRVDPWHEYFNTRVGRGRVLMVGDAQVFDLEVPVLYNTCFDDCLFEQLVHDRTAGQIRADLAAAGISHVYVHWGEIRRYRSPGNYGFTDFIRPSVLEDLVKQGVLEPLPDIEGHSGRGYRVEAD